MEETYYHSMDSVPLEEIVKEEYRLYQIYTLMDRAIPYLQDGLKPSQRRILYTLWRNQNKGLIKVSSLTGLVLTLHPHGPASVESSVVNLAQDYTFSNNYPLIDKKGYFGERMETSPAAGRYIECRLGKVAEAILFDDMNQVEMVPNYDEKVMEPVHLLPKLPVMLLNGAEGIGTGFSSVIPSFHHKEIIKSMISVVQTGKPKKLHPWVRYYSNDLTETEGNRILFYANIVEEGGKFIINELPRGYDASKIYRYLNKMMDKDVIKDYIDSSVDNHIHIELLFKKGKKPELEELKRKMNIKSSLTPNYTLISERGVKILNKPEEIITIFTGQRIAVVKQRYELLIKDYTERIIKNNEIIRFIKEKHYAQAEKKQNRKAFVDYLGTKKFKHSDYLADMAIYRMTKEEVQKRQVLVKEESKKLAEFKKIAKSTALIKKKLIEELNEVDEKLTKIMSDKEREKDEVFKKTQGKSAKKKTRTRRR
jgi:DNA gyrase subunit A